MKYTSDPHPLPLLDIIKDIPIEIDSLAEGLPDDLYTDNLLDMNSFCQEKIKLDHINPFEGFREYVDSDLVKLMAIIGCSGVGKTSFIINQSEQRYFKNHHFITFDLNTVVDNEFSINGVLKFILDSVVYIVEELNDKQLRSKILYNALKRVKSVTIGVFGGDELKNNNFNFDDISSKIERVIEKIHYRDDYSKYLETIESIILELHETNIISNKCKKLSL